MELNIYCIISLMIIGVLSWHLVDFIGTELKRIRNDKNKIITGIIKDQLVHIISDNEDNLFRHHQQWDMHSILATEDKDSVTVQIELSKPHLFQGKDGVLLKLIEKKLTYHLGKDVSITLKHFSVWN